MKKYSIVMLAILLAAATLLSSCGTPVEDGAVVSPVAGKKVAYIIHMTESDIFEMWSDAAAATAQALGMEYRAIFCGDSDEAWKDAILDCAMQGYDGLLLSHGGQDSYTFLCDVLQEYPALKIAVFDTQLVENGSLKSIDGITQFFQQDAELASELLRYIVDELYETKKASGEPVNVLKVWVPDYITAFDRRDIGYRAFEAEGLINTVAVIGPDDFADAEGSMAEVTKATLAKYGRDEIDAIWCCYDLYARGVHTALMEGGYDIPMVSVDLCNADIERMATEGSPWKACATTNWHHNGEFGMRVLALELADEYERIIDPMTGEASAWLELPVSVVTQDMVSNGDVDVASLARVADTTYSDRSFMPTTSWMKELLGE